MYNACGWNTLLPDHWSTLMEEEENRTIYAIKWFMLFMQRQS
jgi:hypothetical protein